jgi:hypothetical protein
MLPVLEMHPVEEVVTVQNPIIRSDQIRSEQSRAEQSRLEQSISSQNIQSFNIRLYSTQSSHLISFVCVCECVCVCVCVNVRRKRWKKEMNNTEILGSPLRVSKIFRAARSRWIMLCLWRWSVPAAIRRISFNILSSVNGSFESYNNRSKLPKYAFIHTHFTVSISLCQSISKVRIKNKQTNQTISK